jgi:hypothetical protein
VVTPPQFEQPDHDGGGDQTGRFLLFIHVASSFFSAVFGPDEVRFGFVEVMVAARSSCV